MNETLTQRALETLDMFIFLAAELTVLFLVISFFVGALQSVLTPEKIQRILSSRNGKGYLVAALLGAITPFCSCSTIPFLKGLLRAKAGFGPMLVFLFSSPLLNPVIIGLMAVTFGVQVTVFYFSMALIVAVTAGFTLEKLGFERYVIQETPSCGTSCGQSDKQETSGSCGGNSSESTGKTCGEAATTSTKPSRWLTIWQATWTDFKAVFPLLMLGVAIGSLIYGFIPTEFIAQYANAENWWAIPIAAVIGIPLYIRAEAVIPLSAALVKKGMSSGSVIALIIGSAGASLTEVILLRAIFRGPMIAAFLTVVLGMAITMGGLYNVMF